MASRKRTPSKVPGEWRNRIVGYDEVVASELEANPRNPRIHPVDQRDAMESMYSDIGHLMPVIVNKTTGLIVDGHMRVGLVASRDEKIPVAYVELTEEEEAKALALMDPVGGMANFDPDAMASLTRDMDLDDDLAAALKGIVKPGDDEDVEEPETKDLKPLQHAHVLISVPIDQWDEISEILDQLDEFPDVTISSTVN